MWSVLFWVVAGVLAIFGLICALWLLSDWLCGSSVCLALRICDNTAREQLDLLLSEAKDTFGGRREIVVLLSCDQAPLTPDEMALIERYRAQICMIDPDK